VVYRSRFPLAKIAAAAASAMRVLPLLVGAHTTRDNPSKKLEIPCACKVNAHRRLLLSSTSPVITTWAVAITYYVKRYNQRTGKKLNDVAGTSRISFIVRKNPNNENFGG